jgi:hypothetical protein
MIQINIYLKYFKNIHKKISGLKRWLWFTIECLHPFVIINILELA